METRVNKHQAYRSSLLKEGSSALKSSSKDTLSTTSSTLPINQVMDALNEDNDEVIFYKKKLKRKYLTISIIVCGSVILIAVISIIAAFVFRG